YNNNIIYNTTIIIIIIIIIIIFIARALGTSMHRVHGKRKEQHKIVLAYKYNITRLNKKPSVDASRFLEMSHQLAQREGY
ncbi:MAG: hypothetical protein O7D30_02950, partial [Rickettsia endosymbiont of Ixodes persulcatus]|nr:hypothetical protein [Rickettsia endosymbiont of Ixodes persulcatus]